MQKRGLTPSGIIDFACQEVYTHDRDDFLVVLVVRLLINKLD